MPNQTKTRPSREQRTRDRLLKRGLSRVDKKARTRAGRKLKESLENPDVIERMQDEIKKLTPPTRIGGDNIYSGKWRGFESEFSSGWWRKQKKPWTCAICKQQIDPRGTSDEKPSIDHIEPWSRVKLGIRTYKVCCNGSHWEVALSQSVRNALQDESNLRPTHQGCNSSKGGFKNTDSINPRRLGDCPGTGCKVRKAK